MAITLYLPDILTADVYRCKIHSDDDDGDGQFRAGQVFFSHQIAPKAKSSDKPLTLTFRSLDTWVISQVAEMPLLNQWNAGKTR